MKWHPCVGIPARHRAILLVICILAAGASPVAAQSLGWSVKIGGGYTGWSGPYETGGQWAGSLIAVAAEMKAYRNVGAVFEFGGAISQARARDATTLVHNRTQLGLIARWYPWARSGKWTPHLDAGAAVWLGATCDVYRESTLLRKKLECQYWEPDPSDGGGPYRPNNSGVTPFVGAGVRHRAFGFGMRYDIGGPASFENGVGALKARTLQFTFEWVFKRLK